MRLNIEQNMMDEKNNNIIDGDTNFTLRMVMSKALLTSYVGDKSTPEEKYNRYTIFKKIEEAPDNIVELSSDEIVVIKKLVGLSYPPLIVGQAWDMLEGK